MYCICLCMLPFLKYMKDLIKNSLLRGARVRDKTRLFCHSIMRGRCLSRSRANLLKSHLQKCQIRVALSAKSAFSQFALTHAWILSPIAFPYSYNFIALASRANLLSLSLFLSSNSKFNIQRIIKVLHLLFREVSISHNFAFDQSQDRS